MKKAPLQVSSKIIKVMTKAKNKIKKIKQKKIKMPKLTLNQHL